MKSQENTTNTKADVITAVKSTKTDHMGRAWYKMFKNGEPIIEKDTHVQFNALDSEHAIACHNQLIDIRKKIKQETLNIAIKKAKGLKENTQIRVHGGSHPVSYWVYRFHGKTYIGMPISEGEYVPFFENQESTTFTSGITLEISDNVQLLNI